MHISEGHQSSLNKFPQGYEATLNKFLWGIRWSRPKLKVKNLCEFKTKFKNIWGCESVFPDVGDSRKKIEAKNIVLLYLQVLLYVKYFHFGEISLFLANFIILGKIYTHLSHKILLLFWWNFLFRAKFILIISKYFISYRI